MQTASWVGGLHREDLVRIGLIVGPWFTVPPTKYGGTERVVDALACALMTAGHQVLLATTSDSTCPVPRVPDLGESEPGELGTSESELNHVIKAYAGMHHVDIIHDHTLAGPLYAHRPPGIPVVTTIHGPLTDRTAGLYRDMAKNTAIVAISHDQWSGVPDLPIAAVIHHGIDLSQVTAGEGKGGYACFVGRMCPDKGLLEAVHISRKAGIPLRIAAKMHTPAEKEFHDQVVQPLLGPNEDFLGELSDPEKYELMGDALVLLNPIQWSEPFGLVMIEALATGTPVLATPRGAAPEILTHGLNGFLAPAGELANYMEAVAGISRAACRRTVEERFTAARMAADHLELYARVLAPVEEAVRP